MIGKYTIKQLRDLGLAGFGAVGIFSGSFGNPALSIFAGLMAAGAAGSFLNRMPDMIAELNGGIQVLRRRV